MREVFGGMCGGMGGVVVMGVVRGWGREGRIGGWGRLGGNIIGGVVGRNGVCIDENGDGIGGKEGFIDGNGNCIEGNGDCICGGNMLNARAGLNP